MKAKESREAADKLLVDFRLSEGVKAEVMAISAVWQNVSRSPRALMHKPSVLFLDEPTAGLDPQARLALWEILKTLHAEGQTNPFNNHYMEEADAICDRLAIMDHGHILAINTPKGFKGIRGRGQYRYRDGYRQPRCVSEITPGAD